MITIFCRESMRFCRSMSSLYDLMFCRKKSLIHSRTWLWKTTANTAAVSSRKKIKPMTPENCRERRVLTWHESEKISERLGEAVTVGDNCSHAATTMQKQLCSSSNQAEKTPYLTHTDVLIPRNCRWKIVTLPEPDAKHLFHSRGPFFFLHIVH